MLKIKIARTADPNVYTYDLVVRGKSVLQCGPSRVVGDRAQARREAEYQADALGFVDGVDFNA